ncbi:alpha/beta fold hydrolase [Streptomyces olivaceus]|uniref:alpha/beta fold hydrolase n=1 Tax=Streptomyces olivaceus TaxID=47716 RepID=UPI003824BAF0
MLQPAVAPHARAVAYDRSGLGRSTPDPAGRTLARMADDLGALLDHFGPGPFLLVGHSAGGPLVRLAASRAPTDRGPRPGGPRRRSRQRTVRQPVPADGTHLAQPRQQPCRPRAAASPIPRPTRSASRGRPPGNSPTRSPPS